MKTLDGMVMDCFIHPKGGWSATVHFDCGVPVGTKLYTHPASQCQPLTPGQIKKLRSKHSAEDICCWSYEMGIKDAEETHGIKD